ncbi:hypothetical protein BP6252_01865 [Coleophoma cylindrospora]|uniref:J domain-containing protein n=1 Tax=Coleophoma cylindrospora TaxID=1849047 RepID=A0A3D8SD49_9HELO|nr:hypothetical protein BP6252_01865 [Coleophoma cylindrospora]
MEEPLFTREQDYYGILGVPFGADVATIRTHYKRLALVRHPDKNGSTAESVAQFQMLQEAYECLSNAALREEYDDFYSKLQAAYEARTKHHETAAHEARNERHETAAERSAKMQARDHALAIARDKMAEIERDRLYLENPNQRYRWIQCYNYFHQLGHEINKCKHHYEIIDEYLQFCFAARKESAIEQATLLRDVAKIERLLALIRDQNDFENRQVREIANRQRDVWGRLIATVTFATLRERRFVAAIKFRQGRRNRAQKIKAEELVEMKARLVKVQEILPIYTAEIEQIRAYRKAEATNPLSRIFKEQEQALADDEPDHMSEEEEFYERTFNQLCRLGLTGEALQEEIARAAALFGFAPPGHL